MLNLLKKAVHATAYGAMELHHTCCSSLCRHKVKDGAQTETLSKNIIVKYMLHMNLLRWRNLIGSQSRGIVQYPMIEISKSGYCFHLKMSRFASVKPLIKTNKSRQKVLTCLFLECSRVVNNYSPQAQWIVGNSPLHLHLRSRGCSPLFTLPLANNC